MHTAPAREFDLMNRTMKLIDDVLFANPRAQAVEEPANDDDICRHCHVEPRDREDSPWCRDCRIVEQEYSQERNDDR